MENHYDFQKYLDMVHRPGRRNITMQALAAETAIDQSWYILIDKNADEAVRFAAGDLQDYLAVSMLLELEIKQHYSGSNAIELILDKTLECKHRGFKLDVTADKIKITSNSSAGLAQGVYYLEDLMNLREAPFLEQGSVLREPVFSPRMVHSGWGLDQYPDSHLNAIAHSGFDAVLLFVTAPDKTTQGDLDFNDLVDRCNKYHLDVYFYSYIDSFKHPDEPDAEEFFDRNYGEIFRRCPRAKGLILVGESCVFPSKDPRTSGANCRRTPKTPKFAEQYDCTLDADHRLNPGWFPCCDYPQWLNAVKEAVFKHNPQADIVFWTYNWGRVEAAPRVDMINSLPGDISLQATFEMFDTITKYPNHQTVQPDYSITSPGPGSYFTSEAQAAKKRGLRLYTMANTAGRTWDFGTAPYVPVPQQWLKRFEAMLQANSLWNLTGVMESHHYGWFPSEISEYAKWNFWTPRVDSSAVLRKIALRDFGAAAADDVLHGWELWSKAIDSYTPGFDDQTGPLRVGPAYPLRFKLCLYPHYEAAINYPAPENSTVGNRWINADYHPEHLYNMSNSGRRLFEDIKIITDALAVWKEGNKCMLQALEKVPAEKYERAAKAVGVGQYCCCAITTMLHTKQWFIANRKLEVEYDFDNAEKLLDELQKIIAAEEINVQNAIPLLEADSRLGWEPSMDYIASVWHLRWKLHHLKVLKEQTLPTYRKSLCRNPFMPYDNSGK